MTSFWMAPLVGLVFAMIACGIPHYDDCRLMCQSDTQCPGGMICSNGFCSQDAVCKLAPDAGNPDGGSADGGDSDGGDVGVDGAAPSDGGEIPFPTTPRVKAVAVLSTSLAGYDHQTIANAESRQWADANDSWWLYDDGWVYTYQAPGTVPLTLYFRDSIKDNFTGATPEAATWASERGYRVVRTEGYLYPDPQPGTVALNSYWNERVLDNWTTASPVAQQQALADGYVFVRTEGYLFAQPPYVPVWRLWSDVVNKNATTTQMGDLVPQMQRDGYHYASMEPAFVRYPVPGTTAVETYYNPVTDTYLTAARPADRAAARDAGFVEVQLEGYIFDAPDPAATALAPISLLRRDARDYLTTGTEVEVEKAVANGFTLVGVQGLGFVVQ